MQLLEQLFDELTEVPFFVKDAELRYVAANRAMARLLGVRSQTALIGKKASDFFPAELCHRYETFDREVLSTGRPILGKFDLTIGAGRPVWLLFTRAPIRDHQGKIVGVAASARRFQAVNRSDAVFRRVDRVARHIGSSYSDPLRLPHLAKMANVSVSQLERDFVRLLGATPLTVLNKTRINHALELLESPLTIARIAQECGYADHSAFSRSFREAVGISPRAYRKLIQTPPE